MTEQASLGSALLSSIRGRGDKGSPKHRLSHLTLLGSRAQLVTQSRGKKQKRTLDLSLVYGMFVSYLTMTIGKSGEQQSSDVSSEITE